MQQRDQVSTIGNWLQTDTKEKRISLETIKNTYCARNAKATNRQSVRLEAIPSEWHWSLLQIWNLQKMQQNQGKSRFNSRIGTSKLIERNYWIRHSFVKYLFHNSCKSLFKPCSKLYQKLILESLNKQQEQNTHMHSNIRHLSPNPINN